MTLRVDRAVHGREDRAAHFVMAFGEILVVADGAGGTGDGMYAAEAVIAAVAAGLDSADAGACVALLARVDAELRRGQTTAVVALVSGDEIHGASVGDSGAWLVGAMDYDVLTEHQRRKPLIGSGRATPVAFRARLGQGTLLLASDVFNYAPPRSISGLVVGGALDGLAERLCDVVRLRSGAWPDDVVVLVARAADGLDTR